MRLNLTWKVVVLLFLFFIFAWVCGSELDFLLQELAPSQKPLRQLNPMTQWFLENFEGVNYEFGGVKNLLLLPCMVALCYAAFSRCVCSETAMTHFLSVLLVMFFTEISLIAVVANAVFMSEIALYSLWLGDGPLTFVQRMEKAALCISIAVVVGGSGWRIVGKMRKRQQQVQVST